MMNIFKERSHLFKRLFSAVLPVLLAPSMAQADGSAIGPREGMAGTTKDASAMTFATAANFPNGTMRGFNLEYAKDGSNSYIEQDYADLQAMKVNLIRTRIVLTRCSGCESFNSVDLDLAHAEYVLQEGQARGFKVVVVLGIPPAPGETGIKAFWTDSTLQSNIAAAWQQIASKLRSYPALAGYDLINEPVPPGSNKGLQQQAWTGFASMLVTSLRKVDSDHVIIFESAPWASADAFRGMQPLPFKNIAYSFHFYYPDKLTAQGLPYNSIPLGMEYPSTALDKTALSNALQPVRDFEKRTGAPIYVGEFGTVRWAPNGSAARYIQDVVDLLDAEHWSWTLWSYRGYHAYDTEIPENVTRDLKAIQNRDARNSNTRSIQILDRAFINNQALK